MRFRQFEVVRLVDGIPEEDIAPGTLAVVIDAHEPLEPELDARYELEVHLPGRAPCKTSAPQAQLAPLLKPGRRELWIMPEYECHSFWATDGTTSGVHDNISADSLDLSPALVTAVKEWEAEFAATFVQGDPTSSGFADEVAEAVFREAGRRLADRVAGELGSGWDVVYRYGETED